MQLIELGYASRYPVTGRLGNPKKGWDVPGCNSSSLAMPAVTLSPAALGPNSQTAGRCAGSLKAGTHLPNLLRFLIKCPSFSTLGAEGLCRRTGSFRPGRLPCGGQFGALEPPGGTLAGARSCTDAFGQLPASPTRICQNTGVGTWHVHKSQRADLGRPRSWTGPGGAQGLRVCNQWDLGFRVLGQAGYNVWV